VVALHFITLVLLLLKLDLHELHLLLGDGLVLLALVLKVLILFLDLLENCFELFDTLRFLGVLLLLLGTVLADVSLVFRLELLVLGSDRAELFLQLGKIFLENLFLIFPVVLLVLKLILQVAKFALIVKNLIVKFINFFGEVTDLLLVLGLSLTTLRGGLLLLLLELSHEFFLLSLESLAAVVGELDLLFVEGFLLVEFTFRGHLTTLHFLLLIMR